VTLHHWASVLQYFKGTWYQVDLEPLMMNEIVGAMYPATQPHIPEDLNPD
jgi:hypothetical protein